MNKTAMPTGSTSSFWQVIYTETASCLQQAVVAFASDGFWNEVRGDIETV